MIDVENVTKTYRRGAADVRALRGLSCTIPAGVMSFIVGPSGSGKSSLLYILGALDQPTSGEVNCLGHRISQLSRRQRDLYRRDQVGFIFQNFNLLTNLNAVENVLIPYMPQGVSAEKRAEAHELLKRVGLGERIDHRPSQLSGGEQQRVAIARALLKRPKLVLADEPTGELDSESGAEVYRYLRQLRDEHGSTVVIVTHDRTHIQPSDHVLTLRDGRVAT
jgi:putative ABC transport system ATP-binding protein